MPRPRNEIIWTVPWDLRNALGHLDPRKLADMSASDLERVFGSLPRKPRYCKAAGRTTQELARLVVDEFGGNAAGIWTGRRASEVRRTLRRLHGVGPALGNMAVLLIERAFGIRFEDLDRREMDIKPDVHAVCVLHRLGVEDSPDGEAAMRAARRLSPSFPGKLDAPLWSIGRNWCRARAPLCVECPVKSVCPSAQSP